MRLNGLNMRIAEEVRCTPVKFLQLSHVCSRSSSMARSGQARSSSIRATSAFYGRSIQLSAGDASRSVNDGATIAAHAQHLRYGLSLMNRWAREGGDPFADATWDQAWSTRDVEAPAWTDIRNGLREEAQRWLEILNSPREVADVELTGMIASIAHLAYHLGAVRQISKTARGPREGTF